MPVKPGTKRLDCVSRRHPDGTWYILGYRDGMLQSIKRRQVYAPGRPWEMLWNAPFWHVGSSSHGRLSARAQQVLEDLGVQVPEKLRFRDDRRLYGTALDPRQATT